jgi:mannosylglycerate hydrolase MGH1-like protein
VPRRVGFLGIGASADAAWQWLSVQPDASSTRLSLDVVSLDASSLDAFDVLWVHSADEPPPLPRVALMGWVERGGRLLLTLRAVARVVALGLEADGPNDTASGPWSLEAGEIRGLAAYGSHPLFAGLGQGTYTWAPGPGELSAGATYARGRRPARGRVVACERSYIQLNADRVVAWEYAAGAGGVSCIGAFIAPEARDTRFARQLGALLRNALLGEGIPHAARTAPAACWPAAGTTAREDAALVFPGRVPLDGALPGLESPLQAGTRALADDAFSVAGRRVLLVGGEQSGVEEIWIHPYRALKHLTVSVGGEAPLVRDVQITPSVVQRHLVIRQRIVEEAVTVALEHPVALLEYRAEKIGRARNVRVPAELLLQWSLDLRRMWPYDAGCGGDLRYRLDADGTRLLVTDGAGPGGGHVLVQANRPVEWRVKPVEGVAALYCTVAAALEEPLRIAVVGGAGREELDQAVRAMGRRGVSGFTAQRQRHDGELRERRLRLRSPDERLNTAFEWAKVRLDGFLIETPGVGRSLAAGYAATRPGWGAGRPGYAWYFGRDACWSAFALLAAGDMAAARLVLRFLGATQDVSGKVIHEYTTSGLAHYDAADSTPLYLLLAGRYAAWTGDLEFLAERWKEIAAAYRFCLETDTDGDGLIENTRVGHGWIEMGRLAGAHVTLYLASLWVAALDALAPVAAALGHGALADEMVERGGRARAQIARKFRTGDGYALGLLPDGTPQRHRTALTAVPLLLGAVDPAPATGWLDAIASSEFSAPWGVRLLSERDPLYDPSGYHTGSVWPLYTGWVSLAEYACHRPDQAFAHLEANGRLPFERGGGAFDEVLRGDEERAAGVCPDQCWSAALFVSPVIEGLLGAQPDALRRHLTLAPHLPGRWRECEWRGLHVGQTVLDVRVERRDDRCRVRLRRTDGDRLGVTVAPALPPGRVATEARVDEEPIRPRPEERLGCRHAAVTLEVSEEHDVEIWHAPE